MRTTIILFDVDRVSLHVHEMAHASKKRNTSLVFTGCAMFRQRVVCSLLSGKTIRIDQIRADDEAPGLSEYEASLLRLVDKITNGSEIEINETGTLFYVCVAPDAARRYSHRLTLALPLAGTRMRLVPGLLMGGSRLEHDCHPSRSIGYYRALFLSCQLSHLVSLATHLHFVAALEHETLSRGARAVGAILQTGDGNHSARCDQRRS